MSDKDKWRWYLKESAYLRHVMGFGMKDGKLTIIDKSKVEKLDGDIKSILRELYREMR